MKKCLALLLLLGIMPAWATPKLDGGPFLGEVMESINAGSYTYLRLKTKDGEVWAATMQSNYPKGTKVQLHDPMLMTNFESRALNKTFDEIVFASAVSTETSSASSQTQQMISAHKGAGAATATVPIVKAPKAPGKNGRTVAEVYAQRTQLKDKPVAVQGTVVKFSGNIMDRNWLHLRDGTGSADAKSNDLIVTTKQVVKVGDVVLVSGVVKTDANYGSGYAYPVVIENATLN
jgi:sporulation protein YlmC with PRC-barrel domain